MSSRPGRCYQKGVSLELYNSTCLSAKVPEFRSHLFCTWGGEGAAALQTSQKTILHAQAFHVEGAGKRVIESVTSSNPWTNLARSLTSIFKAQSALATLSSPASFTLFFTTRTVGIWKEHLGSRMSLQAEKWRRKDSLV